jgi:hypothetical protein
MRTALLLLLAGLAPAGLSAQGLGDTASRERQKREEKTAAAPAKVYTDADLPAPAAPTPAPGTKAVAGGETAPGSGEATRPAEGAPAVPPGTGGVDPAPGTADPLERERQERKLQEAEWRVRFANAREQLAIAEANSWQEVIRTEYYQGIPVQMKVKEQIETEELKRSRQALADLEEEFRRTGLPAGWAREN